MKAFFIITNRCNFDCGFCYYNTGYIDNIQDEMSTQEAYSVVDKLADSGFDGVSITGGEPMIRDDALEIAERFDDRDMSVTLVTNGSFIDEDKARDIVDVNVDRIALSLNEGDERTLSVVEKAVENLRDVGFEGIKSTSVITGENYHRVDRLLDFIREQEIRNVMFQPVSIPQDSESYDKYTLDKLDEEEMENVLDVLEEWAKEFNYQEYYESLRALLLEGKKLEECHAARTGITIDPNGDTFPCFYRKDMKLGNVLKDFDEVMDKNRRPTKKRRTHTVSTSTV